MLGFWISYGKEEVLYSHAMIHEHTILMLA